MDKYKISRYNHFHYLKQEDKYMVYNAISNGLASLEADVFKLLKSGNDGVSIIENDQSKQKITEQLRQGHIIIDRELDEIEFLRTRYNMGKYGQKALSLTIIVTNDCNMACQYCYEGDVSQKYPYNGLEEDILKFTNERIESSAYKGLHVTWYGGEPLLNKEMIFSLSEKFLTLCKEKHVNYSATIVTNGALLTKETADRLKQCEVRMAQITIDGPQKIHDKRRPLKTKGKSSYNTIIKNVDEALGIIPIMIRINVDKSNISNTMELIDILDKKGYLKNPDHLHIYLGYTREWTQKCRDIQPSCFSMKEFSQVELDFHKKLIEKGYNISNLYPSPQNLCSAVTPHGFVIEPGGEIHKCWSDVSCEESYIGHVKKPIILNQKLLQWLKYDPLEQLPECRECNFFPICGGGCPYVVIRQKEKIDKDKNYNCTPWKLLMEEKLQIFLKSRANIIRKEE